MESGLFRNLKILVVDDDNDVIELLTMGLEKYNIQVEKATTILEAKNILQEKDIDVAIVDLHLSTKNGKSEVGTDMAKCFPITRIIFITGYPEEKQRLCNEGYYTAIVIDKPITMDMLTTQLCNILNNYTQHFCNQIFTNVLGKVSCLEENTKDYNKMFESIQLNLDTLNSSFSGLNKSYGFIFDDLKRIEDKMTKQSRTYYNMHETVVLQLSEIKKTMGKILINGNGHKTKTKSE